MNKVIDNFWEKWKVVKLLLKNRNIVSRIDNCLNNR